MPKHWVDTEKEGNPDFSGLFFVKQKEFREHCRPVLDATKEPKPLPPKLREFREVWPKTTGSKMTRVTAAAGALQVSNATIYRYLKLLDELDESA